MRVLVTGATGFIGGGVVRRLADDPRATVRAAVRSPDAVLPAGVQPAIVGDIHAHTEWSAALHGVDVVVHAAARVHVMQDSSPDPLAEFRRVNVEGTLRLARQAADAGVRRLVFLSSIKVNGEETPIDRPYRADDPPAPLDAYGRSKHEAEEGLRDVAARSGLEITVIRPVLVYGPGVRANFRSMLVWLRRGLPLPLGAVHNRRSLVALENLVDLIVRCLAHPAAAGETFLVSDGEDLSTPELLHRAATALGTTARLLPVPPSMLLAAARLTGREGAARRLCGSLCVDIARTRRLLAWHPPASVEEALSATAADLLGRRR